MTREGGEVLIAVVVSSSLTVITLTSHHQSSSIPSHSSVPPSQVFSLGVWRVPTK